MKIYLIGMPGSGKTTLGRQLAGELMMPFVDLDKEIEKREGKSVQQIFAEKGEDHFRKSESESLREWAASSGSFVMATGGGTPCFYDGIGAINKSGLSIFLDVPLGQLLLRLDKKTDRPLLLAADAKERERKLNDLRTSRLEVYERANITVKNADLAKVLEAVRLKK